MAILAAGGVLLAGCGREDVAEPPAAEGAASSDTVPMMVLDPVPDGLTMAEVISAEGSDTGSTIHLFGDPDAGRPFVGGDLAVQVFGDDVPVADDVPSGAADLDASQVTRPLSGKRMLPWTTDDGRLSVASSHSLSPDELVAGVQALDQADPAAPPTAPMPRGLQWVHSRTDAASTATMYAGGEWVQQWIQDGIQIVAHRGDRGLMTVLEWESGTPATPIEVDGRPGVLLEAPDEHLSVSVVWAERDDVVVVVRGAGRDEAELLAIAEDVRRATAAEVEAADIERSEFARPSERSEAGPEMTTAPPSTTTPAGTSVVGAPVLVSGRSGGVDWHVTVAETADNPRGPTMCLEMESGGTCSGLAESTRLDPLSMIDFESGHTGFDGHTVAWGRTSADVARVRIDVVGRPPIETGTVVAEGFNGRFYAVDIGTVVGSATFVAFDASGVEIGRRTRTVPEPRASVGG